MAIRIGFGRVGSKPRDLGSDRGYRVAVAIAWVGLNLNPHPLKAEGAAPNWRLGFDEVGEGVGGSVEAGEDGVEIGDGVMADEDFAEDGAEVGGESEVAAVVELGIGEAGPASVNAATANVAAHDEHAVGVAVVGAAVAVFFCGASEFAHGDDDDVLHAVTHVLMERGESLAEIFEEIGELAVDATFVDVI